jgi:hypothetical protein
VRAVTATLRLVATLLPASLAALNDRHHGGDWVGFAVEKV